MAPDRFPPVPPSELKGDQVIIHQEMLEGASAAFAGKFIFQRKDGALVGPFAPLMYTPLAVARNFFGLAIALGSIPGFPPSAREAAILATGAHFEAGYEMYAHDLISEKTEALTRKQIDKLVAGQCPAPEDGDPAAAEGIKVAYDVTTALINGKGPLKDELWAKAKATFGSEGASALVQYCALYSYVSILINGFDVPVPKEDDGI